MRGAVEFTADDKPYTLRFSVNALVRYQDRHGETAMEAFTALEKSSGDLRRVRGLFWCALSPDMPLEDAGDVIDAIGLQEAGDMIAKAASLAFNSKKEKPASPPKAPQPAT